MKKDNYALFPNSPICTQDMPRNRRGFLTAYKGGIMRFNDLASWIDWIKNIHTQEIDLGLDRVKAVANRMDLFSVSCPVVIIGGTNGKGSTVAGLENIYREAGYRVGAFTTPFLLKVNEIVRITGQPISDDIFMEALAEIDAARGDISITPFEFTALAALTVFKKASVDVMVLEVGMGGRLDAVNIMEPDVSIVTSVQLDHMAFLGDTREKIGFEKAGIFRANKPAICGDMDPPSSLIEYAQKVGAVLFRQNQDYGFEQHLNTWGWWSQQTRFENLPMPRLLLQNMASVLLAVELLQKKLPVPREVIDIAIRDISLPGRMQVVNEKPTHIYDVSHNPAAVSLLRDFLQHQFTTGKSIAVFSMLGDKDIDATLAIIKDTMNEWFVAPLKTDRAADQKKLQACFHAANIKNVQWHSSIAAAHLAALASAGDEDRIIVFGSFHTVEEVMKSQ